MGVGGEGGPPEVSVAPPAPDREPVAWLPTIHAGAGVVRLDLGPVRLSLTPDVADWVGAELRRAAWSAHETERLARERRRES